MIIDISAIPILGFLYNLTLNTEQLYSYAKTTVKDCILFNTQFCTVNFI